MDREQGVKRKGRNMQFNKNKYIIINIINYINVVSTKILACISHTTSRSLQSLGG